MLQVGAQSQAPLTHAPDGHLYAGLRVGAAVDSRRSIRPIMSPRATPYTALEQARRRAGLSQEELAALAGVSTKTIGRAERGWSIREASMRVLAMALGQPVGELFGEAPTPAKLDVGGT